MPDLVLIGAPGAGKSTVGRLVAQALQVPFADSDELVEAAAGLPLADIFVLHGEQYFRDLEESTVLTALAADGGGVLALGGGAVMAPAVADALAGTPAVWLQVDDGEAVKRVGLSGPRPVLLGNVRGTWAQLLSQRTPLYDRVANWRIPTTGRSPEDVAGEIAGLVRSGDG